MAMHELAIRIGKPDRPEEAQASAFVRSRFP
jgi:hypothetical protein